MTHLVPMPEVQACVLQVYEKDGRWWRHCLTCDDGSNKYQRHPRGHTTKEQAQMSARDHEKAAMDNKRWRAWSRAWVDAILEAQTWDEFAALYKIREQHLVKHYGWPRIDWENFPVENREQTMRSVKETYVGARPLA